VTYTFKLRPNLKFQDETPCDASAVKYCFDRMLGPEKPPWSRLHVGILKAANVVDPLTVQLVLNEPFAPYLNNIAHLNSAIYSPTPHQKYGDDLARNQSGTGPYRLVDWKKGD
jgi:ABC-type transport system substrate-binding protein